MKDRKKNEYISDAVQTDRSSLCVTQKEEINKQKLFLFNSFSERNILRKEKKILRDNIEKTLLKPKENLLFQKAKERIFTNKRNKKINIFENKTDINCKCIFSNDVLKSLNHKKFIFPKLNDSRINFNDYGNGIKKKEEINYSDFNVKSIYEIIESRIKTFNNKNNYKNNHNNNNKYNIFKAPLSSEKEIKSIKKEKEKFFFPIKRNQKKSVNIKIFPLTLKNFITSRSKEIFKYKNNFKDKGLKGLPFSLSEKKLFKNNRNNKKNKLTKNFSFPNCEISPNMKFINNKVNIVHIKYILNNKDYQI